MLIKLSDTKFYDPERAVIYSKSVYLRHKEVTVCIYGPNTLSEGGVALNGSEAEAMWAWLESQVQ